jgi:ketosteroid isomerase-like protein
MFNRIFLFIVVFAMFSAAGFAQKAAAGKVDPTKDVRAAFDRLSDGIRQVDVDKLMSVYDNNADILFFNQNGSVTRGWEQMKENRTASFAKIKNVTLETTGVRVEMLSPTSAYVTFKWKQQQEYDGKLESASGRTTIVFKKIGKEWKAVHLHTSPDNPGPTRPVLDSERIKTN